MSGVSCWHPFGCQAPGEGCVGRCPVTPEEAERIEADYLAAIDPYAPATEERQR